MDNRSPVSTYQGDAYIPTRPRAELVWTHDTTD
jgi:hypothetical protein